MSPGSRRQNSHPSFGGWWHSGLAVRTQKLLCSADESVACKQSGPGKIRKRSQTLMGVFRVARKASDKLLGKHSGKRYFPHPRTFFHYIFVYFARGLLFNFFFSLFPHQEDVGCQKPKLWNKKRSISPHETAQSLPRIGSVIFASAEKILSHVVSPHTSNKNKSSPTIQDSPPHHVKKAQVIQPCLVRRRPLENTQCREHSPPQHPHTIPKRRQRSQPIHQPVVTALGLASVEEVAKT